MMSLGMMIGAGVFIGMGICISEAGPGGLILTFALNGLLAIFTAMSFAELSSAIPRAGGVYNFARISFGRGGIFYCWMDGVVRIKCSGSNVRIDVFNLHYSIHEGHRTSRLALKYF
jgi:amino acid transporter